MSRSRARAARRSGGRHHGGAAAQQARLDAGVVDQPPGYPRDALEPPAPGGLRRAAGDEARRGGRGGLAARGLENAEPVPLDLLRRAGDGGGALHRRTGAPVHRGERRQPLLPRHRPDCEIHPQGGLARRVRLPRWRAHEGRHRGGRGDGRAGDLCSALGGHAGGRRDRCRVRDHLWWVVVARAGLASLGVARVGHARSRPRELRAGPPRPEAALGCATRHRDR